MDASFITQLKSVLSIEDVISPYASLKREGRHHKTLCPFHMEKTPSFVVYEDTQSFYCFGCGAGGDIITFIMKMENLEYMEAVGFLAKRAGLEMPERGMDDKEAKMKARILEMNKVAARYFHSCLKSDSGKQGRAYLKKRGLELKTITRFGLGYAPDSWTHLKEFLLSKQFTMEEMQRGDMLAKSRAGNWYPTFKNKVMFPIIDLRGNIIAFGGRVLDDSKPKYRNSSDTLAFKKSRHLFALNFAKNHCGERVLLAEGYMDVIALHQAGFENVVATLGTALTTEQSRLLSRYTKEVLLAYDADEAGQIATSKASRLLGEYGLDAKVLHISQAKDPDEYIQKFGPVRFKVLMDKASTVAENGLMTVKNKYDLNTEEGKTKYVNESIAVIANIGDVVERDVYVGKIAEETGVLKEIIAKKVNDHIRRSHKKQKDKYWEDVKSGKALYQDRVNPQRAVNLKEAMAEEGILDCLLKNPDYYEYILSKISIDDFVTDFNRKIFGIIEDKIQNNIIPELSAFAQALTVEEMGKIAGVMAKNSEFTNSKKQLDDYIDVLIQHRDSKKTADFASMSKEEIQQYYLNKKTHE